MKTLLSAAIIAAAVPAWAAAQVTEEYQPLVEPLSQMLSGCLEQSWDTDSAVACNRLTIDACHAMGPGGAGTYGMSMCVSLLGDLWDAEMKRVWPLVLADVEDEDLMRREQEAWEAYRDAYINLTNIGAEGGSMAAYAGGFTFLDLTSERLAHFLDILR